MNVRLYLRSSIGVLYYYREYRIELAIYVYSTILTAANFAPSGIDQHRFQKELPAAEETFDTIPGDGSRLDHVSGLLGLQHEGRLHGSGVSGPVLAPWRCRRAMKSL